MDPHQVYWTMLQDYSYHVDSEDLMNPKSEHFTVEALLTDTLVSGQLYLRPPCLKPRFNSHTNSVFLHSRKRTFP